MGFHERKNISRLCPFNYMLLCIAASEDWAEAPGGGGEVPGPAHRAARRCAQQTRASLPRGGQVPGRGAATTYEGIFNRFQHEGIFQQLPTWRFFNRFQHEGIFQQVPTWRYFQQIPTWRYFSTGSNMKVIFNRFQHEGIFQQIPAWRYFSTDSNMKVFFNRFQHEKETESSVSIAEPEP